MDLVRLCQEMKKDGTYSKSAYLKRASQIGGVYVPSLYDVTYNEDGTIQAVIPKDGAPAKVVKRIVQNMSEAPYPDTFIVPYM